MAPKKKSPDATPAPSALPQVPHEVIAQRAYEFFVARGYAHGCDLQDWFQAERELTAKRPIAPVVAAAKPVRRRKTEVTRLAS